MLPEDIKRKINFEIEEIENELNSYQMLFDACLLKNPDHIEMTAIASVIHSFYNGIENIFIIISKNIDKDTPKDFNWHITILNNMAAENKKRNTVISKELCETLEEYLAFRHFFRHSYKFKLEWEKIENLVKNIFIVWNKFKTEIRIFINGLK